MSGNQEMDHLNAKFWVQNLLNNPRTREEVCSSEFRKHDKDRNGTLEIGEVHALVADVCQLMSVAAPETDKVVAMFEQFDKNHDTHLSEQEFKAFFKALLSASLSLLERVMEVEADEAAAEQKEKAARAKVELKEEAARQSKATADLLKKGGCPICSGPCKCSECHGNAQGALSGGLVCSKCKRRGPCFGGDTLVLLPSGAARKLRDCRQGDDVRTLTGSKRIARIWELDPKKHTLSDVEVCCIDGVWITSHHPVISGNQWVYPVELQPSSLWREKQSFMPDMYNLELEGHDDTILLWGGGQLLVSCTIGKYLGARFGAGACTRRSTRCPHSCAQCDSVFVEGLRFDALPVDVRWGKFAMFPQVEWESATSEFQLAEIAMQAFIPPKLESTFFSEAPARCGQQVYSLDKHAGTVGVASQVAAVA